MDVSGVVCGEIGGKRDWKTVVMRDSRCLGICCLLESPFVTAEEVELVKLFMTRSGGLMYGWFPPVFGCFIACMMSLHRE